MKSTLLLFLAIAPLSAEVHNLNLKQAVDIALNQNPDLTLARIDQQRAELAVQIARDPFVPKVGLGSGLAYTNGYPMSIEGSAPTVIQVRAIMAIYNPAQSYLVAQARENMRTAAIDESSKRDEVALRTASLFLDVLRLTQARDAAKRQAESYQKVEELVRLRVGEGRALPIVGKQAEFAVKRALQRSQALEMDMEYGKSSLALVLGFGPEDRVNPVEGTFDATQLPPTEDAAVETALASSKDVKKLESQLQAKGFEARSYKSARKPSVDLVAQYGMLARRNYQDFFGRFQRNNGQLGVSIQLPLMAGAASGAQAFRAEAEIAQIHLQVTTTRDRITVETRRNFQLLKKAEMGRDLAKTDLELTREQLSVNLAQMQEGRAALSDIEQIRAVEDEKWIAFYDAQLAVERAQLTLLHQTGTLLAAVR
jgi:outer membrane protein TolC